MLHKSQNKLQWRVDRGVILEGDVPGGNSVTVGYRFPPGPCLEVQIGKENDMFKGATCELKR